MMGQPTLEMRDGEPLAEPDAQADEFVYHHHPWPYPNYESWWTCAHRILNRTAKSIVVERLHYDPELHPEYLAKHAKHTLRLDRIKLEAGETVAVKLNVSHGGCYYFFTLDPHPCHCGICGKALAPPPDWNPFRCPMARERDGRMLPAPGCGKIICANCRDTHLRADHPEHMRVIGSVRVDSGEVSDG